MRATTTHFMCYIAVVTMFPLSTLAQNTIKVMSFNLRYGSASDGSNAWANVNQSPDRRVVARNVLLNRQPDLVGFQEGEAGQLDDLASQLPATYRWERQQPSGGGGNEHAAFAFNTNVLELIDRGVFSLGPRPGGGYWNHQPGMSFDPWSLFPENHFPFPRLALWGKFRWKPTGQEFLFYTTHFDVYNGANSGTSQVKSAALITDDALARTARMPASPLAIVVGDFNSNHDDRAWKLFTGAYTNAGITGDFTDSWYQVHGTWNNSGTMHEFAGGIQPANRRIDWILHRGGFTATQSVIVTDSSPSTNLLTHQTHTLFASDHYPVFATLRFPPPSADIDRDGLPDTLEIASTLSHPTRADSDGDGLLDGEEDINGNGLVEGGESDPSNGSDTQRPTDIRNYQMDGLLDFRSMLLAQNGLKLYGQFDGRYLYVATQDAGEGSDHFIFIATNPAAVRNAPWAKSGSVGQYVAFLADENNTNFVSWFNDANAMITNLFTARAATYFENGGWMEGVIDLASFFGPGFTGTFYMAAAPYGTVDGGSLVTVAQVPSGNGDANILGLSEYVAIIPGDRDGDGINNAADPDSDGDGLPDGWEIAFGLDPARADGDHGAHGDLDNDGVSNRDEFNSGTSPSNEFDYLHFRDVTVNNDIVMTTWSAVYGKTYHITRSTNLLSGTWSTVTTNTGTIFPSSVLTNRTAGTNTTIYLRLQAK